MCNRIHVKRLARFLQNVDQLGRSDAVTDAKTGESVDFREGPQHDDISAFPNESKRIGRVVQEFEIGFVEHGDNVIRHFRHVDVDLALGNECAGRVVRVGDEDETCFRSDGRKHCVEICFEIGGGHFDGGGAE